MMRKPYALQSGDKVAIVSLSNGMLGEERCRHQLALGAMRLRRFGLEPVFMPNALRGVAFLREHPRARAEDLKLAFQTEEIRGVICAIGGDDTYRLLPYLMEDEAFCRQVTLTPKLFTGFSDTTVNHLMFYRLGLTTAYGPNFLSDLAELSEDMLPYTERAFRGYLAGQEVREIVASDRWYEERMDFSAAALGTPHPVHRESHGFELLQGPGCFRGRLWGGCMESLYDLITSHRYGDEGAACARYGLMPKDWTGLLLFLETCEEKPDPDMLRREIEALRGLGAFDGAAGVLVGKPQDECWYEEYKQVWRTAVGNPAVPILYNVNFGHALPRCALPYGVEAAVDAQKGRITLLESMFDTRM